MSAQDVATGGEGKLSTAEAKGIAQEVDEAHQDAKRLKMEYDMSKKEDQAPASLGEKIAEGVAAADQDVTTKARDATHATAEASKGVASKVADAAGAVVEGAKDTATAAYESAKNALEEGAAGLGMEPTSTKATGASDEVLVEVGDTLEQVKASDLQEGQPATEQVMDKHNEAAEKGESAGGQTAPHSGGSLLQETPGAVDGSAGGGPKHAEDNTPPGELPGVPPPMNDMPSTGLAVLPSPAEKYADKHVPVEIEGKTEVADRSGLETEKPTIASPQERYIKSRWWPIIASPKEAPANVAEAAERILAGQPQSYPEGKQADYGVGDPGAGAQSVAVGRDATHGVIAGVKDFLGIGGGADEPMPPTETSQQKSLVMADPPEGVSALRTLGPDNKPIVPDLGARSVAAAPAGHDVHEERHPALPEGADVTVPDAAAAGDMGTPAAVGMQPDTGNVPQLAAAPEVESARPGPFDVGLPGLFKSVVSNIAGAVGVGTSSEHAAPPAPAHEGLLEKASKSAEEQQESAADKARSAAESARESVSEAAGGAADRAREAADQAKDAAQSVRDSAAGAVEGAKEAVSGAADTVKDAAGAAKDKAADAAQATKDYTSEAAGSVTESSAADSAKSAAIGTGNVMEDYGRSVGSAVSGAAERVEEAAGAAKDRAAEATQGARDKVTSASESATDKVTSAGQAASGYAADTAGNVRDSGAADTAGTGVGSVLGDMARSVAAVFSGASQSAKETAGEAQQAVQEAVQGDAAPPAASQGQREMGAAAKRTSDSWHESADTAAATAKSGYDAAAEKTKEAASAAADKVRETGQSVKESLGAAGEGASEAARESADSAKETGEGLTSKLAQAWDELKHGGGKPARLATEGESDKPWDMTSNIERSQNLEDPQQRKIYEGEVYKTQPAKGSLSEDVRATQDQIGSASTAQENVAGGDRGGVTGTVKHERPEGPQATASKQPDRFGAGGHAYSNFGTGSAAPWDSMDDSIKRITQMFTAKAAGAERHGHYTDTTQPPGERASEEAGHASGHMRRGWNVFSREADAAAEDVKESARAAGDATRESARDAYDSARDTVRDARDRVDEGVDDFKRVVKEDLAGVAKRAERVGDDVRESVEASGEALRQQGESAAAAGRAATDSVREAADREVGALRKSTKIVGAGLWEGLKGVMAGLLPGVERETAAEIGDESTAVHGGYQELREGTEPVTEERLTDDERAALERELAEHKDLYYRRASHPEERLPSRYRGVGDVARDVRDKVGESAQRAAERTGESAGRMADRTGDALRRAGDRTDNAFQRAGDRLQDTADDYRSSARDSYNQGKYDQQSWSDRHRGAAAPAGEDEGLLTKVESGLETATYKAGRAAGKVQANIQGVRDTLADWVDALVGDRSDFVCCPPAVPPTNTDDLLRQREHQTSRRDERPLALPEQPWTNTADLLRARRNGAAY